MTLNAQSRKTSPYQSQLAACGSFKCQLESQLEEAQRDLDRQIYSIEIPLNEKAPRKVNWTNTKHERSALIRIFGRTTLNRGRLLGRSSGGIVDCDLDAPEAVRLAPAFLLPTSEIHGRPSKPKSHYWYVVAEGCFKTTQFKDESGAMLVEVRGDGAQTVVPPSLHPSGESIAWAANGQPSRCTTADLLKAAATLAAASLLLRNYPKQGGRHAFTLALAGTLLEGGCPQDLTVKIVGAVAESAGDDEVDSRLRNVETTAGRLQRGEPIQSRRELISSLGSSGDKIVRKLEDWLKLKRPNDVQRFQIVSRPDAGLTVLLDQARQSPATCIALWLEDADTVNLLLRTAKQIPTAYEGFILRLDEVGVPVKSIQRLERSIKASAKSTALSGFDQFSPYSMTENGIFECDDRGRRQLANFSAKITREILEDDGCDQQRLVEIEATLAGKLTCVVASMADFQSGNWISQKLGIGAVLSPGIVTKDRVRYVIQHQSGVVPPHRVYKHLGWREFEGNWCYLHGAGAIGAEGAVNEIEVSLPKSLGMFSFAAVPQDANVKRRVIQRILQLIDVAEPPVIYPLLGALFRAVIDKCDFGLHLTGLTGTGKSELAALIQQFFGREMTARNLPGSWSSTPNALESAAFVVKDAVLVVDDFCPAGTKLDIDKLNQSAERLFRAQGNSAGRQRLGMNLEMRAPRFPRGLILSTGEDVFRGHSLRARTVIIELRPQSVRFEHLSTCQQFAAAGDFASGMAAFLQWLAPQLQIVRQSLREFVSRARSGDSSDGRHRRIGDNGANIQFGWDTFIRFIVDAGGIDEQRRLELEICGKRAIQDAIAGQDQLQRESDPVDRFLELLRSGFASYLCHLEPVTSSSSGSLDLWGWKKTGDSNRAETRCGECVGWIEKDDVYLQFDAAYRVALKLAQGSGESLPLGEKTLAKRLRDRGVLKSFDENRGRISIRKTINCKRRPVVHLAADSIAAYEIDFPIPTRE